MAINNIYPLEAGARVALYCQQNAEPVQFTGFGIGSGENPNPQEATALVREEKRISITSIKKVKGGKYRVRGELDNSEIEQDIIVRELGLYCADPENGGEVLYLYGNAKGEGFDYSETIPAFTTTGTAASKIFEIDIKLEVSQNPTFTLDPAGKADIATVTELSKDVEALGQEIEAMKNSLLNFCYPVGSLYWSSKPTDPAELFGGTWKQIKDRFILAAGDTYKTVDAQGGASSVTLTTNNLPSHTHSFTPAGSIKMNSHTHSFTPAGSIKMNSHTHSFTPAGKVTVGGHTHGLNNHTHSFSATTGSGGGHEHNIRHSDTEYNTNERQGFTLERRNSSEGSAFYETTTSGVGTEWGGSHTHSVSGTTGGSGGNTASATPTGSFTGTAGTTGGQTSTGSFTGTAGTTGGQTSTGSFTGTAGTTGETGGGASVSIMPPYELKYCWERIA